MDGMKVQHKETKVKYTVYGVRNDKNGYPQFLIYDSGSWKWLSAKHFEPEGYVNLQTNY